MYIENCRATNKKSKKEYTDMLRYRENGIIKMLKTTKNRKRVEDKIRTKKKGIS